MDFNRLTGARRVPEFDPAGRPDDGEPHAGLSKRDLRARLLSARRELSEEHRQIQDTGVRVALESWLDDVRPATVAGYVPMTGEPGGPTLPDVLRRHAGTLLLPVLRTDLDLDWARYDGTLAPGLRGLREPTGPRLGPDAIERAAVVIVPALAVDPTGVRLGRGGGSYDRALARVRRSPTALVVALLYHGESLPEVPAEAHDVRVDLVVTPNGIVAL